jgi:hypothetical protein
VKGVDEIETRVLAANLRPVTPVKRASVDIHQIPTYLAAPEDLPQLSLGNSVPKALVKPGEDAHIGGFGGVSRVVLEETARSQILLIHRIS